MTKEVVTVRPHQEVTLEIDQRRITIVVLSVRGDRVRVLVKVET